MSGKNALTDKDFYVVSSSGRYLACNPTDPGKRASGEFGFELDVDDDGNSSVRLGRLSIDLSRVQFGANELNQACRDAELLLSAIGRHGDQVHELVNLFKSDPAAAAQLAQRLGLTEADFQSQGGGLWFLVVLAIALVVGGCAVPAVSSPGVVTLPVEGEVVRPCGYRTMLIKGRLTGFGSSRTSPERAASRARKSFRDNRSSLLEQLQKRFALKCAPPCRPKLVYSDDGSDAVVSGAPGAGGGGPLFAVEFDTQGNFGVSIPGPSGGGDGGRVYATVTRAFSFQMVCEE